MALPPKSRLELPLRAFDRIGTDYGGPFYTKQGRRKPRAKRYVSFYLLSNLGGAFGNDLFFGHGTIPERFHPLISRRGTPSYVISDNGTNFVANQAIQWKFNPPAAPHFGGVFEAMIKAAKKALRTILGEADVTDEELHTAMCSVEGLLNSRPIRYVSAHPHDLTQLTLNHFIIGQLGGQCVAEAVDVEEYVKPTKRWRQVQKLVSQLWKRWIKNSFQV